MNIRMVTLTQTDSETLWLFLIAAAAASLAFVGQGFALLAVLMAQLLQRRRTEN